jgi:polyhydroxyalkanoate synthesis regulator phasin
MLSPPKGCLIPWDYSITYSLEIIMDTNAIINAAMQQLIDTVSDAVICKLKAEGSAHFSLESELLNAAIVHALEFDATVRESIRDMVTDTVDNTNLSNNSEFSNLETQVSRLEEKLEELDAAVIDPSDDNFCDAVRSVIRNNI